MITFITYGAVGVLLVCSALFSGLTIGILSLNHYELKRKAQLGDSSAKIVYPIRALGHQLMVTLLIGNVIVNAAITAILNTRLNGLFAVLLTTIFVVTFGEILPMAYLRKNGLKVAARLAPLLRFSLLILAPFARPLGHFLDKWLGLEQPSIYSKEELYKILEEHRVSNDSEIEADEVKIVRQALSFGDKQVRQIMTPRRVVHSVDVDDLVGPVLIDELHKSGFSRFPVVENDRSENQKLVGTLYLRDLINFRGKPKKVKTIMREKIVYVHEEMPLDHALKVAIRSNQHLLVVVNSFEDFVGVITMEDIIEEILGQEIVDEFDQQEDMRAVAKSFAEAERRKRQKQAQKPDSTESTSSKSFKLSKSSKPIASKK